MRRTSILGLLVALIMAVAAPVSAASPTYPDVIDLPNGFFPEGIAVGRGPRLTSVRSLMGRSGRAI